MKDENISLLWQLQKLEEEITEINKEIKLKEIRQRLKVLKFEYENFKKYIKGKVAQYKEWEHKLTRINLKNKNLNYEIKELQDKIYGGKITNITALSKLESELVEFKKEIDRSEEEMLGIMEKKELIQRDIKNMKKNMLKIQGEYKLEKDNYNIEKENIQNKQNILSTRLKNIQGKIEEKYIIDYRNTQKNIKQPMAKIKNGICTGCNMNISIILLKDIKESPSIYLCETCGRILYMEKN